MAHSWPSFQDDESRQILSLHVIRHKDLIVIKTSQREFVKRFFSFTNLHCPCSGVFAINVILSKRRNDYESIAGQ